MAERVDRVEQTRQRLSQIEYSETLDKFGLMDDSKIKIRCFEAQNLVLTENPKVEQAYRDNILEPQAMF